MPGDSKVQRLGGTRIVAAPEALDAAVWPDGALVLRLAADEAFVLAPVAAGQVPDPHAIVEPEGGFAGIWLDGETGLEFLATACEWALPANRPAFAQGMVAGLPAKVWLAAERVLILVPAPYAATLEERLP